jgi:hypothetical protein
MEIQVSAHGMVGPKNESPKIPRLCCFNKRNKRDQRLVAPSVYYFNCYRKHVTTNEIIEMGGRPIITQYGSLATAIKEAYGAKDVDMYGWNEENEKEFVNNLLKELKIKSASNWYKYSVSDIKKLNSLYFYVDMVTLVGGESWLRKYNDSLLGALKVWYPRVKWKRKFLNL